MMKRSGHLLSQSSNLNLIDDHMKAAIENALISGLRVQLKQQKDGSVKVQVITAKELKT